MRISIIAAMAKNRVIGINNTLPWRLPADLAYFKSVTMGKPIIMGRKTYQSLGKPLPGRTNIVLTHDKDFEAPGCKVAHSLEEALAIAGNCEELMVIGGSHIFDLFLPVTHRIYLTLIDAEFAGDAFFPALDLSEWQEVSRTEHEPDEKNLYRCKFLTLDRHHNKSTN